MKKKFIHPSASLRKLDAENILAGSHEGENYSGNTEKIDDSGTSVDWAKAGLQG